ncbi:hypothetical protein N7478_008857 [Penicillium angulare]|uniref:uncharacterized protein n=1 Tax=Penicillium angulare TaxID=116970 RepID=UPI002540862C|nr:uncharacterized protein N7478_008857 [Penicillium angulare]KAJ5273732.1 hypothetical protein N7478_008857 [Penicillium angulare]
MAEWCRLKQARKLISTLTAGSASWDIEKSSLNIFSLASSYTREAAEQGKWPDAERVVDSRMTKPAV